MPPTPIEIRGADGPTPPPVELRPIMFLPCPFCGGLAQVVVRGAFVPPCSVELTARVVHACPAVPEAGSG